VGDDELETEQLIGLVKQGDRQAFAALIARYQPAIRGFAALWSPSRDEADDIAQEVFVEAFRSVKNYDTSRDLKTWLLGITRNLTRQAWRRVSRGSDVEHWQEVLEAQASLVFEERFETRDSRREALNECLKALPEHTHAVFTGYFIHEATSAEIAQRMQTKEGTVRALICRTRKSLRQCIERRMFTDGARS
jgi:RNA polymerase sigma factor (sigma-70 family)